MQASRSLSRALAVIHSATNFKNDVPKRSRPCSIVSPLASLPAQPSLLSLPPRKLTPSRSLNTGGAVWTTTSSEFKTFFETGEITDRALAAGIANSGWTADDQEGMTKTYAVDIVGVSRFLYSEDGVKFKDQTRSYFPY